MITIKDCPACPTCGAERARTSAGRVVCRPCANRYARDAYARDPEEIRRRKRESMRAARSDQTKRDRMNEIRRSRRDVTVERQARQNLRERHFFRHRAMLWNSRYGRSTVTPWQLAALWIEQRGRCALTGDKLDRAAVLDHRTPRSRGGKHDVSNLQWVTAAANTAKNDMLPGEFVDFCARVLAQADPQVGEWIGRRLRAALHSEVAA